MRTRAAPPARRAPCPAQQCVCAPACALRHLILLSVSLLSAFAYSPNFPLTDLPAEYRELLKLALAVTLAVNTGTAAYAATAASARGLSAPFWVAKCLLLGGVALSELTSIALKKPKP